MKATKMNCLIALLIGTYVNQALASSECVRSVTPLPNFRISDMAGTYYLIAQELGGYKIQTYMNKCEYSTAVTFNGGDDWNYIINYELANGTDAKFTMKMTTTSGSGIFHCTDTFDKENIIFVAIPVAAEPKKFYVSLVCNHATNMEALGVYYYKRVQGLDNIEPEYLEKIKAAFAEYNIGLDKLVPIKQTGCNN